MVIFFLGTLRWQWFGLVALLCMFAIEQWGYLYVPYIQLHSELTNIFILCLVGLGVSLRISSVSFDLRRCKIRLLAVTLLSYAFLSTMWTPDIAEPLLRWKPAWPYLVTNILLATILISKTADLRQFHKWLVLMGGGLLVLFAFVPEFVNRRIVVGGEEVLALPLALAELSGYVLIAAIFYFRKTFSQVVLLGVAVLASFMIMIKTGSRGQLIFSIAAVLIVLPKILGRDSIKNIAIVIVCAGLLMLALSVMFEQTGLKTDRWAAEEMQDDVLSRFQGSIIVLKSAFESPLTMIFGLGNSAAFSPDLLGIYPHIVILEVLAEEGLIGFVLFTCFFSTVTVSGWRLLNNRLLEDDERRVLAVTYAFWLFAFMTCFKQGSLITSPNLFLFAALYENLRFMIAANIARRRTYL